MSLLAKLNPFVIWVPYGTIDAVYRDEKITDEKNGTVFLRLKPEKSLLVDLPDEDIPPAEEERSLEQAVADAYSLSKSSENPNVLPVIAVREISISEYLRKMWDKYKALEEIEVAIPVGHVWQLRKEMGDKFNRAYHDNPEQFNRWKAIRQYFVKKGPNEIRRKEKRTVFDEGYEPTFVFKDITYKIKDADIKCFSFEKDGKKENKGIEDTYKVGMKISSDRFVYYDDRGKKLGERYTKFKGKISKIDGNRVVVEWTEKPENLDKHLIYRDKPKQQDSSIRTVLFRLFHIDSRGAIPGVRPPRGSGRTKHQVGGGVIYDINRPHTRDPEKIRRGEDKLEAPPYNVTAFYNALGIAYNKLLRARELEVKITQYNKADQERAKKKMYGLYMDSYADFYKFDAFYRIFLSARIDQMRAQYIGAVPISGRQKEILKGEFKLSEKEIGSLETLTAEHITTFKQKREESGGNDEIFRLKRLVTKSQREFLERLKPYLIEQGMQHPTILSPGQVEFLAREGKNYDPNKRISDENILILMDRNMQIIPENQKDLYLGAIAIAGFAYLKAVFGQRVNDDVVAFLEGKNKGFDKNAFLNNPGVYLRKDYEYPTGVIKPDNKSDEVYLTNMMLLLDKNRLTGEDRKKSPQHPMLTNIVSLYERLGMRAGKYGLHEDVPSTLGKGDMRQLGILDHIQVLFNSAKSSIFPMPQRAAKG